MNTIVNLEKTRLKYGDKIFIERLESLINNNKTSAITQINSQNISFYTFFLLIDIIKKHNLQYSLNTKYIFVLNILEDTELTELDNIYTCKNSEYHNYLLWIFKSGYKFDGYSNDFDKIIDYSAVILLLYYKNHTILKEVCSLIFKRNREDLFNHDLVWCFLKSKNKSIFYEILNYFKSNNSYDKSFAHELLSQFTDEKVVNSYSNWLNWLNENGEFLYYSNEHFGLTSNPRCYSIDFDSKFLGKPCVNYSKNAFSDGKHIKTLSELHKYDEETVKTACMHSVFMRKNKNFTYQTLSVDDKVNLATKYAKETKNAYN